MQTITTFDELLINATDVDFCRQHYLLRQMEQPATEIPYLIKNWANFIKLAAVNDLLAAKVVQFECIRNLVTRFTELEKLANIAPETTATLLNYLAIRKTIKSFRQLQTLLNRIELLRITLPPHQDIRALVKNPSQLSQLSQLAINNHSDSNLAQLFISYADVRKRFTTFKQLLQFITHNPSTSQFFIKDEHIIQLVKNAKQLNNLLGEISKFNRNWAKKAAVEFSYSEKVAKLFKEETELLNYLQYLPDQASIRKFIEHNPNIEQLFDTDPQQNLLEMAFFKAKKSQPGKPSIPFSLLQYA